MELPAFLNSVLCGVLWWCFTHRLLGPWGHSSHCPLEDGWPPELVGDFITNKKIITFAVHRSQGQTALFSLSCLGARNEKDQVRNVLFNNALNCQQYILSRRNTWPSGTSSVPKPQWTGLSSKPGLRCEKNGVQNHWRAGTKQQYRVLKCWVPSE